MSAQTGTKKPPTARSKKRKANPKVKREKPFVPKMIDDTEEGVGIAIIAPVAPNPFKKPVNRTNELA